MRHYKYIIRKNLDGISSFIENIQCNLRKPTKLIINCANYYLDNTETHLLFIHCPNLFTNSNSDILCALADRGVLTQLHNVFDLSGNPINGSFTFYIRYSDGTLNSTLYGDLYLDLTFIEDD